MMVFTFSYSRVSNKLNVEKVKKNKNIFTLTILFKLNLVLFNLKNEPKESYGNPVAHSPTLESAKGLHTLQREIPFTHVNPLVFLVDLYLFFTASLENNGIKLENESPSNQGGNNF